MTVEIAIVLGLLFLAVVLFGLELLPVDVVTLCLLVGLVVTGVLTPAEAFSGFANDMVVILASVFVLSGAMVKSGLMDGLAGFIQRLGGAGDGRRTGALLTLSAATSAFLSNTVATAALLPSVLQVASETRTSPSKLLMPVAYASILGGACTLIGTSTNIAGSAMAAQLGLAPFSMFEFAAIGLVMAVAGILWLVLVGHRLIPDRVPAHLAEDYDTQQYLSTLVVAEKSRADGAALGALNLPAIDIAALSVIRDGRRLSAHHRRKLREGDRLIVRAPRNSLLRAEAEHGLKVEADEEELDWSPKLEDLSMAEAVLTPQSNLLGQTLRQVNFPRRYGAKVIAVHRSAPSRTGKLDGLRLRVGDVLLLQGARDDLERLRGNPNLWGLVEVESTVLSQRQGAAGLLVIAAAILLGAAGALPLSIALLSAALIFVVAGFLTMQEAYRFVEWRLLILIAGMTSFGGAMIKTGAAGYLAGYIVEATLPFGVTASMAAFAVLTILLTQPMSNAAAALAVLPLAVVSADALGVDPRSLAILVTLSASLSFITPLEPACLLVYGPGRYRFRDFVVAGLPLTAICVTLLLILVPVFWPL